MAGGILCIGQSKLHNHINQSFTILVLMNYPKYLYKSEGLLKVYLFTSEGFKGNIQKMVQYTDTGTENVYNLGFGDYNEVSGTIDDLSVTNNGDSLKVLATVVSTVYAFTEKYPEAWIRNRKHNCTNETLQNGDH